MSPWVIWVPLLALINLLCFVAVRGRWGRIVPVLAVTAGIGVVIGDAIASEIGFGLLHIGDMHVVGASVMAQVLMVAVSLLAALGPVRVKE